MNDYVKGLKIFNACLVSGIYPEKWAEGCITPLYKANDMYDPGNYRGLTITSAIGKLFNLLAFFVNPI
jgi:hypothetical protein